MFAYGTATSTSDMASVANGNTWLAKKIRGITSSEYVFFSSLQVNGASVELGSSDRVAVATAKGEIRRRGPFAVSPQVYGSNLEPYLLLPEHQGRSKRALEWTFGWCWL